MLGSSEDGRELHVEANGLLKQKWDGREILFSEVAMKWGANKLKKDDVLVSMCERDVYYIARHFWEDRYRLDTWKVVRWSQFNSESCESFKNVKSISMSFKKKGEGNRGLVNVTKTIISVGSCRFKWNHQGSSGKDWKNIEVICKGDSGELGKDKEDISLTLKRRDYKLFHKFTIPK